MFACMRVFPVYVMHACCCCPACFITRLINIVCCCLCK
uniref:Uncharacterized protein n=1 Tax=Trypanosoma vivax (strain Y486) TaxID=1055687 RepID=G0U6N2_TRYVY|nr:hypothetical protein TVY486_1005870 [Trypanosoma vivax Y486]